MSIRKLRNHLGIGILGLCLGITSLFLIVFIARIFYKGFGVLSWEFVSTSPRDAMTAGGIYPAIVGTFWLTVLSIGIALPLGVFTAIYLACYGKPLWFVHMVKIAINTLAGIPSIIYGLFGMAIFVNMLKMDVSLLSGSLTLAILALPIIINASEEAIRSVPKDFRDASMALGATERQTIMRVLLPTALPNILTGAIISIGRVAGETAPIMFTAATFYSRQLPKSVMNEVMALPYHIYALMTEGTHAQEQVPIAYGTALILLLLVLTISAIAIYIRFQIRKKRKW
ncbi:MAG: phosphate ABC transporter, permease protein PstA [Candidatus Cloacimonetes bacterium HGW-Cloacimonetes-1]|jgi:phosphate transport system permease protein|nr:MAG: phosphate ABC transporter, permease protein PstA [Candidatus Cloacimonetes bacterium HGW-Cloacimonetes-1]